jgi:magnesium-transporting ATPase (P-type)
MDEVCLLEVAKELKDFGWYKDRDTDSLDLTNETGEVSKFQLLRVFEFDSDRKAMSVVVRDTATKKIYVFVKGADSSIKTMLKKGDPAHDQVVKKVYEDVEVFAEQGLRTLTFAYRELNETTEWVSEIMLNGWDSLRSRDVESEMTICGATGVEDLLQENVKVCI